MQSDAEFLGLTPTGDPGRFRFTVINRLARLDGRLYGGTAIAVSITASELLTDRSAVWMTTQFVATAGPDEEIFVNAEVLAPGRRTNQVRVTGANAAGETMFASLGATGHHRDGGLAGAFERAPTVQPVDECEADGSPFRSLAARAGLSVDFPPLPRDLGFSAAIEFRLPEIVDHPDPGPGRVFFWVRRRDREPISPALASYVADMVPLSIAHACGEMAGGISLDNSIRIGSFTETEWVLVDLRPHLAAGDYGHGAAHLWSEDGTLLATASQSASMFHFGAEGLPPWAREGDRR